MSFLSHLRISHFRNLSDFSGELNPDCFHLIHGENGSGKTSLLEVIYYLSHSRSFRTSHPDQLIHEDASNFSLYADICTEHAAKIPIRVERAKSKNTESHLSGNHVPSTAELAELLPSLLIDTHSYQLLESGSAVRRRFLDWGAFYAVRGFLKTWQSYQRLLKQRNAILKQAGRCPSAHHRSEVHLWGSELAKIGEKLHYFRQAYFESWCLLFADILQHLTSIPNLRISYCPGWQTTQSLEAALANCLEKDLFTGYTAVGPHRADLKINVGTIPAKEFLSRGQQKLLVCAMLLAAGALLNDQGKKCIYLIDDLASELDIEGRRKFIRLLAEQKTQIFMTAIELDALDSYVPRNKKMFHVKRGTISAQL